MTEVHSFFDKWRSSGARIEPGNVEIRRGRRDRWRARAGARDSTTWSTFTRTRSPFNAGSLALPNLASAAPAHAAVLNRSAFTPLVGRTVVATGPRAHVTVTLAAVRNIAGAPAGSQSSYLLQFTAPKELPDDIYTLAHSSFGQVQLFVSGVGRGKSRRFEAIVNRTTR